MDKRQITETVVNGNDHDLNKRTKLNDDDSDAVAPGCALPVELASIDFSKRISWGKYHPYTDKKLEFVPLEKEPQFTPESPALCHHINSICHRARACTIHLHPQPGQVGKATPIPTPMFMPVGTKGCLKGLSIVELTSDPALSCPIILGNTYHLAIQPGTDLIADMGGLHSFQGLDKVLERNKSATSYNLLTDSGGFQMVSLVKLSNITEQGVHFQNPFHENEMLLLTPEDSIQHQNNIGANIIMALDDVVSSVAQDEERFRVATHRTLRWYDRCCKAHAKADTQNLFPIVQGALDTDLGGLREQCLAGFRYRQEELHYTIPGYAIGGLAGGEGKGIFWRVVDQCCKALPDDKPRYLMGVGYPLDLVVCTALGIDLYDCVYPTRTARFGAALVPAKDPGTLRLRSHECATDKSVIQKDCGCQACRGGITRARIHMLLKTNNPLAVELLTQHNIAYMMALVRGMRKAILEGTFAEYVIDFLQVHFPKGEDSESKVPEWVVEALDSAGIQLKQ